VDCILRDMSHDEIFFTVKFVGYYRRSNILNIKRQNQLPNVQKGSLPVFLAFTSLVNTAPMFSLDFIPLI
jgi:hypothetical protein